MTRDFSDASPAILIRQLVEVIRKTLDQFVPEAKAYPDAGKQ
jgi:hypothetical protein